MITFKVDGLKELEAQLLEIGAEAGGKILLRAVRKAFEPVVEDARARAPVDTGLLRDAIKLATANTPTGFAAGIVFRNGRGGTQADLRGRTGKDRRRRARLAAGWRWHFAEKGTSKMPARPFLRPALDRNASRCLEVVRSELQAGIAAVVRKHARRTR